MFYVDFEITVLHKMISTSFLKQSIRTYIELYTFLKGLELAVATFSLSAVAMYVLSTWKKLPER